MKFFSSKQKKATAETTETTESLTDPPLEPRPSFPLPGENKPLIESSDDNINRIYPNPNCPDAHHSIPSHDTRPCFRPWRLTVIVVKAENLLASDGVDLISGRLTASSDPMVGK